MFEFPIIPTEVYLLDLNFYKEKSGSLEVVYLCFIFTYLFIYFWFFFIPNSSHEGPHVALKKDTNLTFTQTSGATGRRIKSNINF